MFQLLLPHWFSPSILCLARSARATGLLTAAGTQVANSSFRAFAWSTSPGTLMPTLPPLQVFAKTSQQTLYWLTFLKLHCYPFSHLDPPISLFCTIIFYRTYYLLIHHVIYLLCCMVLFHKNVGRNFWPFFPLIYIKSLEKCLAHNKCLINITELIN